MTADKPTDLPKSAPSTSGMTTKVVKGSAWTLAGSVLPLAVAFVATPFVIRFLGSEAYGVLLLVGLIPTYFSFADIGMGVASTKFASEAYGERDEKKESEIVWTAATIAALSSLMVTIPIFFFSLPIVRAMNVPEYLLGSASIALKITSVGFFLGVIASVINSPMLARLRMDLNTVTQAGPKVLLGAGTPIILYLGGGIVEAVSWALLVAFATLIVVFGFSARLLPSLSFPAFRRELVGPLFRFGGAWFVAVIAGILIGNLEKFILTSQVSVQSLAYYSIAFTCANIATLFSQAALQSLLPAFSQLMSDDRRRELEDLFSRGIRLSLIVLLPTVIFLFIVGGPFLTIWAGEEFGRESTIPFYILLGGFSLSLLTVLPYSVLLAAGRTDYFAKMYWLELPVYAVVAWFLIDSFQIKGAAIAFGLRTVFDGIWAVVLCKRETNLHFRIGSYGWPYLMGVLVFCPVVILSILLKLSPWLVIIACVSFGLYGLLAWAKLLDVGEKQWVVFRVRGFLRV